MDRIKASPDLLGRYEALSKHEMIVQVVPVLNDWKKQGPCSLSAPRGRGYTRAMERVKSNMYFWWSLGFDQGVHHLTHYGIIYLIITLR
jgi:hypothetical protein